MIGLRLSIMMFLQFFVWGAWYVTPYLFLGKIGFGGPEIGWMYSVGPIAGMLSPFFVGMVADRFFSTERVLGVLHIAGGGIMYLATTQMAVETPDALTINLVLFGYMLCYFPTLSLVNSLALHNMTNAEKQFPLIRVFGTIGWILAGWYVSGKGWGASIEMFKVASWAALVMGLYSFTLPHTPPPMAGKKISVREVLGLDALVLLKQRDYLTFMVCSLLICIPLAFYYQLASVFLDHGGLTHPLFKMSFGQISEILFMLVMPLFFARLGVKWMLFVGMLAWVFRYGLFAMGASEGEAWMLMLGVVLHGICYDFFFVTGQIYTDRVAPKEIRGQAQGMLVFFTLGLGMFIGAQSAGQVEKAFTSKDKVAIIAKAEIVNEEVQELQSQLEELEGTKDSPHYVRLWRMVFPKSLTAEEQQRADKIRTEWIDLREERSDILLTSLDWKMVWGIPAALAAIIMVVFTILFKEKGVDAAITEGDAVDAAAREPAP